MTETDARHDGPEAYERVNFFSGMMLTSEDLRCEQAYHRGKHAAFVRAAHGVGTVCGLAVRPTDPPGREIVVDSGLAVDRLGREIVVPSSQTLAVDDDGRPGDDRRFAVALRYAEVAIDPVPVPAAPDAHEGIEPSRIRESFELSLTDVRGLAPARRSPPDRLVGREGLHSLLVQRAIEPCSRATERELLLAVVTVPASGAITSEHIDNTVRPIVLTDDLVVLLLAELDRRRPSSSRWSRLRGVVGRR